MGGGGGGEGETQKNVPMTFLRKKSICESSLIAPHHCFLNSVRGDVALRVSGHKESIHYFIELS